MFKNLFHDLLQLCFPARCLACDKALRYREVPLCTQCLATLPWSWPDNLIYDPFAEKFWGKVPIQHTKALFKFDKQDIVQNIIHNIKYKNHQKSLRQLGQYYGQICQRNPFPTTPDLLIPVPLHPKRLLQRGYNQSLLLAQGMAATLQIPCNPHVLLRRKNTTTQTTKNKKERIKNMQNAFTVSVPTQIQHQHLLLIDDVVTTGATLKSCAHALLNAGAREVSIAVLAINTIW